MTRFTRAPSPYILPATALSVVAVFVLDFNTQLGVAAWVFYFIPVVISYLAWHPRLPVLVAFIATVMTLVGYFMSAPGMDQATARVNRSF
ncbi:MAG TPA: hypothetical protein VFQ34_12470, partial [Nitrospiraceae bacterium]|nr:hypothetical protein [Nitrospiraceae bacterium]